jgi:hypothetical protein
VITIKDTLGIINVNQIKEKLKCGEYNLTENRQAKSTVWKPFHEEQVAATKGTNNAVHCVKCQVVLSYSATETGSSHLSHHFCKFSAGKSNLEKCLHPSSSLIHRKEQNIKWLKHASHCAAKASHPLTMQLVLVS